MGDILVLEPLYIEDIAGQDTEKSEPEDEEAAAWIAPVFYFDIGDPEHTDNDYNQEVEDRKSGREAAHK